MKNEITIPEHFPALKKEDLIAADQRREKYTLPGICKQRNTMMQS